VRTAGIVAGVVVGLLAIGGIVYAVTSSGDQVKESRAKQEKDDAAKAAENAIKGGLGSVVGAAGNIGGSAAQLLARKDAQDVAVKAAQSLVELFG